MYIHLGIVNTTGFPGGSVLKNLLANAGAVGSIPGQKDSPGEGNGNHSSILVWEIHGQRSLSGYSPWCRKRVGHHFITKQQQQK